MRSLFRPAALVLLPLLSLATACGDGEEPDQVEEGCPKLHLEVSEARPLQEVRVEGLPERFGELLAAEVVADGASSVTLVSRTEGADEIILHAPIHPEARLEGGEVSLRIVDDAGRACEAVPFRILPLAEAPGTTAAVQERIGAMLDGVASYLGTSVEALRAAELDEVPAHLLPLYLAQEALDAPANPDSLRALLDGTAPSLEGGEIALPLVDALLAEIGLVELLDDSLGRLGEVPSPNLALRATALQSRGGPENAFQLHAEMEMAQWGDSFSGDGPLADGVSKTSGAVGLVGLIPHAATRGGAMVLGSAAFSFTKGAEAAANLLPSRFVSLDFELSRARFVEDDDSTGRWADVLVVAASKGWQLDRALLESLLQFTKVKGGYDKWLNRFGPPAGFREALGGHLETQAVKWVIGQAADGSGVFSIPPEETQPIDITEDPWSFARISLGLMGDGRQGYRLDPSWEGEPLGEVWVGTALGMFGGNHIYATKEVSIDPLRIAIDPSHVAVEPGEVVHFQVTVHGKDKAVSVHAEQGTTAHQPQPDGTHLIIYEAPHDERALPDTLTVTSYSLC